MTVSASRADIAAPVIGAPTFVFSPGLDGAARLSAAPAGHVMERAVLRPIDLNRTHGFVVTTEILRKLADTYDPVGVEVAALNFDHDRSGPGHGWCKRLWLVGEMLWARFEQLSTEAAQAIESGRWPRCSAEIRLSHPATQSPYFTGLAMLGSQSPAVYGLPPATLLSANYRPMRLDAEGHVVGSTTKHLAGDHRDDATRQFHRRGGLTDARFLELEEKYCTTATKRLAADHRDDATRLAHRRGGLTDERFLELEAKYRTTATKRLAADHRDDATRLAHRRGGLTDERFLELAKRFPEINQPAALAGEE